MSFDFDTVRDRRGTGSLKWDVAEGELPMWVADMDFQTAPCITKAISDRAAQGIYGYSVTTDEWGRAYSKWWSSRHGLEMDEKHLVFATGVIAILSSAVRAFSRPNENVVVMTPVYNVFFNCIYNNGRRPLESPLHFENGVYSLDMDDLEAKLSNPQTSLLFLCNPQNPSGNIWSREELERIGHMAAAHDVIVIADEIHCDITDPGYDYVPFASVSEECAHVSITAVSPTKTFNLAGIQTAAAYSSNDTLRHRLWRQINTDECGEGNVFSAIAAQAAFNEGGPWLDELRAYIRNNKKVMKEYLDEHMPELHLTESHATYLQWVDVSAWLSEGETGGELAKRIRSKTGLFVNGGSSYRGNGDRFIRINIACPVSTLMEGLERLNNFKS